MNVMNYEIGKEREKMLFIYIYVTLHLGHLDEALIPHTAHEFGIINQVYGISEIRIQHDTTIKHI